MVIKAQGRGPGHVSRNTVQGILATLFAGGVKGGVWLPENSGVAVGNGVATVTDTSPNAVSATQAVGLSQPIRRNNATTGFDYLEFDGSDDSLSTAAIDLTGTDAVTIFAALHTVSQASAGVVAELSASAPLNTGTFVLQSPSGAAVQGISYSTRGDAAALSVATANSVGAAPVSHVITAQSDISTDTATIRLNGIEAATSAADQGAGNYGNYSLFIGSRNGSSRRLNGHLYGLIVLGRAANAAEVTAVEQLFARRIGVTLP